MRVIVLLFILWGLIFNLGCQPQMDVTLTMESVAPGEGDITMTPALSKPADPGLQNLIERARADLAQRLAVSASEIVVLQAESVTWPDGSLGCPQEGMQYAQVLTPGYLIRLGMGDQEFEYHASRGTAVIYCENPSPPVPGIPADT